MKTKWLIGELFVLFLLPATLLFFRVAPLRLTTLVLIFGVLLVSVVRWLWVETDFKDDLKRLPGQAEWVRIGKRFVVVVALLVILQHFLLPGELFGFPKRAPGLWLLVVLLYPFLSVVPQEIIYRVFFFKRYKMLFTSRWALLGGNAFLFGFLHIFYRNPIALVLTLVGGWLLADTYKRSRSLLAVSVEHFLYGIAVFSIGLGTYFYHGYVQ